MTRPIYEKFGWTREQFRDDIASHLEKDWSIPQLANRYEISGAAIGVWMKKFGLKRRVNLRDPDWLRDQYEHNLRSSIEIANECGVTDVAVRWHLKKNGIRIRDLHLAQQIAQPKRTKSPLHQWGSTRSSGYIFWFNDMLFRSVAEYLWYVEISPKYSSVTHEPFVYQNKRPDFLVETNKVVEIKDCRKNFKRHAEYALLAAGIKRDLGYDYEIVFVRDEIPERYEAALQAFRIMGATPGIVFSLLEEI